MTDTPFLQLSERWRLAYDRHQWIVQRKRGKNWDCGPFISSTRAILIRYMLEDGVTVDDWRAVLMLPDTFKEWLRLRAEVANKATASAERALKGVICPGEAETVMGVETAVA